MPFLANPFNHLFSNSKISDKVSDTEADKILSFVIHLVNREDLIDDLVKKYGQARMLALSSQNQEFIPIYLSLEAFIIRNKPLIIKQEFTKDELRETIRKQYDILALDPSFRLLFLPEKQQNILLFEIGILKLSNYLISNIGFVHLKSAVSSLKLQRVFFTINEHGISFDTLDATLQAMPDNEIKLAFQELYRALLTEEAKTVGVSTSEKIIINIFDEIKKTYDYDIIAKFLDVLPEGILENERISRLGRDELENKIQARTRELDEARRQLEQKLIVIKKQNDELSQAKQALLTSLQEEKRLEIEISKEKEQVEEKVRERTRELELKTKELNDAMSNLQTSYQQTDNERARLLASINSLTLGFIMTDSNDTIIAINKITYKILKCQGEDFTTIHNIDEYLNGIIPLNEYIQICKTQKTVQNIPEINFHNVFLRFFFTPIMMDSSCIGVVIILEDISEAKLLERSKDEFFAIASHELRTPLTAIRGYTSLIMDTFPNQLQAADDHLLPMVTNIHKSSIRLIKIVNNFLDASKLEQGKFIFNLQNFSLKPVIEEVVTDLNQMAIDRHIYLKFDNEKNESYDVYADLEKVKQVIINLVGNAIKFTEKGGVTIFARQGESVIKVCIRDTGLGVSDEYRQLLFKKFQQAGERILTRDAATGSGMGLYVSKLLVESMNGAIAIEDTKLGEGSTFSFTLPIAIKQ